MNNWTWGDDHFLFSDNLNHLFSGFHLHPGAASTMRPQTTDFVAIAMKEEPMIIRIVKEYMKNTI